MTKLIDRIVSYISPGQGVRRAQARQLLAYYEAGRPSKLQKQRRETGSGNDAVGRAGTTIRQQARHMDQNYDLASGVLNTMVANTIGPNGIHPEPQPRNRDGSINEEMAKAIAELYADFCKKPEVTWQHDMASAQRIVARTWFRDGEAFTQTLEGFSPFLDHGTKVPLSLELLEPDYVPLEYSAVTPMVVQGIEMNAWRRPVAYYVYKTSPIESIGAMTAQGGFKRLPADRMLHIATRHRIGQARGVSCFASVMNRFDDLKDYEESERIAAKVAASMAAFIKKGNPDNYAADESLAPRSMKFRPGMVFDDLRPGEEIGVIDTNRPNPNLETYRSGQLKAVAAGTGASFSSVARTYTGTYSAQRQELVEAWPAYAALSNEFIGRFVQPVYEKFIALAILSGKLKVPAGVNRETVSDALFIAPQMPWIDPEREAKAWKLLEDNAFASGPEIIRKRGGNPHQVLEQERLWRQQKNAAGIVDPQIALANAYSEQTGAKSKPETEPNTDSDDDEKK